MKMKPVDVKPNTYIDFDKKYNKEDPEFKVHDQVWISKYKNIFTKAYIPNWSEEVFEIKNFRKSVPWTYVISDINDEEIVETFYEKELPKKIKNGLELKK